MIRSVINQEALDRLFQLLDQADNVVLTCHRSPDGDALGSVLALRRVLAQLGKNANVVIPDRYPATLAFLPTVNQIITFVEASKQPVVERLLDQAQLIFCLDFNSMQRIDTLGPLISNAKAPKVLIDHHERPEPVFDLCFSYPEMSSTCELVYRILMQSRMLPLIDKPVAICLYVGMMTDTGNFTYSCEDPDLYEIQASLMRRKINKQQLFAQAMNTFSEHSLRLQGYALDRKMTIHQPHGVAVITLDQEELLRYKYQRGDTEGLVNRPLSMPAVRCSIFVRQDPEIVKISCRSKGDLDVSRICSRYFGGGGHINAAGGDFKGTIQQALHIIEHEIIPELTPTEKQPTTIPNE